PTSSFSHMSPQTSRLCAVPDSVLEHIALEVAVAEPLGPPAGLVPLLRTCRRIHTVLDIDTNHNLYAKIFTLKFDKRAANRRIGEHAVYSSNLAFQLRKYCLTLQRICTGDVYSELIEDDLWTAYLMLLENDGKNAEQLLEYAKLDAFVDRFMCTRLWENRLQYGGWPAESTANSLAVWLYFMTLDQARLSAMTLEKRNDMKRLVLPYNACTVRYPFYHAPDNHFDFPISPIFATDSPIATATPHGWWPLYRAPGSIREHVYHFGSKLAISAPLLAQGARLVYMTLCAQEPWLSEDDWARDREEAIALGRHHIHPTKADIAELNADSAVRLYSRGDWDWRAKLSPEDGKLEDDGHWRTKLQAISARWYHDWTRITGCIDPTVLNPYKGHVYTPGTLNGLWKGRISVREADRHFRDFMTSPTFPDEYASVPSETCVWPVCLHLREHHSINPEIPVAPGGNSLDEHDDGLCNAWFPTLIDMHENNGIVRVHDHVSGLDSVYETYVDGRPNSHSEDTCTACISQRRAEEARQRTHSPRAAPPPALSRATSQSPSLYSMDALQDPSDAGSKPQRMRSRVNAALGEDIDVDKILDGVIGSDSSADEGEWSSQESSNGSGDIENTLETVCSGIQDIIVTGETLFHHGQAWGHCLYYGRVRAWDGLIAIVRQRNLPAGGDGTRNIAIFRGYVVGGENFVGSMRHWSNNRLAVVREGPFIMTKLYNPYTLSLEEKQLITVSPDSGLIVNVQPFSDTDADNVVASGDPKAVDLRTATVLPGFVDVHVHFFLHPYSEVSWNDQLTKEHLAERTVRATVHAKRTLMAGYTSVRDLGTEGAADADIALRNCLSGPDPTIPGPRYFCANRAIVTTGSYGPKSGVHLNQEGVDGITGAEVADGVVECVKAVRRQIGAGADWIKVREASPDYRFRSRMSSVSSSVAGASLRTFDKNETEAIIATAHALGVKVAAHSQHWPYADVSVSPDSIEHGYDMSFDRMLAFQGPSSASGSSRPIWVPTLAVYYTTGDPVTWARASETFQDALRRKIQDIACGGDTGVFPHGDNALEMKLMARLGADWRQVLRWGTLGGWECIRSMAWEGEAGASRLNKVEKLEEDRRIVGDNEMPFGAIRKGFAADIVATVSDLEKDFENAVDKTSITFVMKAGRVYKRDGIEVL
ncbi:hypothetical protein OBBRIDRAFT_725705, partial [Obba rivulosa]